MKALILVSGSAGKFDKIRGEIKAIKGVKEAFVVTGRADVAVFVDGSLKEINRAVTSIFRIKGVVATESLLEVV
jgi:DNA-binding Lrp family transcriptional regulator